MTVSFQPANAGSGEQTPCLFLSHSGADTEAARELKRRILASPAARAAGLTVWFDKDDLDAGTSWQEQLEVAITRRATAFAVLIGSKGVINWVEREVRLGLARATGADAIPFVPILAEGARPEIVSALPAFAQQYQGVADPLNDPAQFSKLVEAVLGGADRRPARLTDEPFVGLRAMTERESDRFFGRSVEVGELVEDLRRHRLIAIVADSGAGKSSLAMAGLAPAFRGALMATSRRGPDDAIWHVVVMRPGGDPVEGLRRGVTEAAERMGLAPDLRAGLRRRLTLEDAAEAAYALRCDLPAASTETLLIVDQFDELLTETPEADRAPFIDLLLKLAAMQGPGAFHVVLTVRVDYFNLCRPYGALYTELQASERVLRLKRMSDDGLEKAVRAPLRMAGFADEDDQRELVRAMRRDLGDRPGDLALAQMALWTVWRNRFAHGGSLLRAYIDVGGVSGALAQEAERVRLDKLSADERELLPALFVRLVRLGETGGVLRRIASKDEFDADRRALAEKLAGDDHGRLLFVGEGARAEGTKIEVCHEALITQWPWLQNTLNAAAADLRVLERLMDRAGTWAAAAATARENYLATGAERALFAELGQRRDAWLSADERAFIRESDGAFAREEAAKRRQVTRLRALVAGLAVVILALAGVVTFAVKQTRVAEEETRVAKTQTTLAEIQKHLAEAQRTRADRDFAAAKTAINHLIFDIAQGLEHSAGMSVGTLRRVLQTVKATIDVLASSEPNDRELQRSRFVMLVDFAAIYLRAGDLPHAEEVAGEGVRLARQLASGKPDPSASRDLAIALDKTGEVAFQEGKRAAARAAYEEELAIDRKRSEDKGDALAQRDFAVDLERIGDIAIQAGDRASARKDYEEELAIFRGLAKDKSDAKAQRSLAIALERSGDMALQMGDRAGALASYQEELAIFREVAKDESDAQTQRFLAIALEKVGDVATLAGDRAGARASYQEELSIFRDLAKDKDDAQAQRSLAIALEKTGDVATQAGDRAGARAAYGEELAIFRYLAKDASDAQARRSLAIALEKSGDLASQEGDRAGARADFEEELAIDRDLAKDKGDAQAQRSFAIALEKAGDMALGMSNRTGAGAAYEQELAIFRGLAKDKGDAQAQRDLAVAFEKIGGLASKDGDLKRARAAYEEELAIFRELARDKGDAQAQRSLAIALEKIGDVTAQASDRGAARAAYQEELAIFRDLARDKGDAPAQRSLAIALEKVANLASQTGDKSAARAAYEEELAIVQGLDRAGELPKDDAGWADDIRAKL